MFKFRRTKGHHVSAERQKQQKELFDFNPTVQHGFPNRPTALAWDPKLKLMAIGTKTGAIKVYGQSGVEYYFEHKEEAVIVSLLFIPNEGRLISLCSNNDVHLFEINPVGDKPCVVNEIKSFNLEGKTNKISCCCLHPNGKELFLGTEAGNIFILDVQKFGRDEKIIYQDVVIQNAPEGSIRNPGPVEIITFHPSDSNLILLGYERGLIVLWDNENLVAKQTYVASQQLESLSWNKDGSHFISAHNDGTYIIWSESDSTKQDDATKAPYGPFPCKAINKVLWNTQKDSDFVVFSGGLPRASFGDRNAVTVTKGDKHQVLDLTTKVIDFFTIYGSNEEGKGDDEPHSLVILAEEELVVVDLLSEDWPVFHMPYLVSLHSSAIISTHLCSNVPSQFWDNLVEVGKLQNTEKYSEREWPINGGKTVASESLIKDLLLTGHENGVIRFWDASDTCFKLIYELNTAQFFDSGEEIHEEHNSESQDVWPPFRKVGVFDPYSDDPRLAVKKLDLDPRKGVLVSAGTAGQVAVFKLNTEEVEKELQPVNVNIVEDRDGFVWKAHDALGVKSGSIKISQGFQPTSIIQISPPAALTALSLQAEWGLVGAGTAYGLCLVDFVQQKNILTRCTLNPNDLTGAAADTSISRRKSFKKSLRESFRRLRKGRSQRNRKEKSASPARAASGDEDAKPTSTNVEKKETNASSDSPSSPESVEVISSKPVERQIEARQPDDNLGSIIRCLYFARCYIINSTNTTPTFWAGSNGGSVLIYAVKLPESDKREEEAASCQLAKEIQLKHRAPVLDIKVFDQSGAILPCVSQSQDHQAQSHKVLISSEEQYKVFTLPQLKPFGKYKLTAHDGTRIRKVGAATFVSNAADTDYSENCITCLNNIGQVMIISLPDLRKQKLWDCTRREDINDTSSPVHQDPFSGMSSLVFGCDGQGFYLHSPCEFQRFSLSTKNIIKPVCEIELPEGARPEPEPETKPEETVKSDEAVEVAAAVDGEVKAENTEAAKEEEKMETDEKTEEPAKENEKDSSEQSAEKPHENDVSNTTFNDLKDDDSKLDSIGDITIDSVKDHLGNMTVTSTEESSVTVTKTADCTEITKTDVTTEEKVITMTKTIVVNAEG